MNRVTEEAITLRDQGWSTRRIARRLGVSQVAVWKFLKKRDAFAGRVYGSGCCEICGRGDVPLDADHDHDTGKARGMLCRSCNAGLGHFGDDIERLSRAIEYLGNYLETRFDSAQAYEELNK